MMETTEQNPTDPVELAGAFCQGKNLRRGELTTMIRELLKRIPIGEPEEAHTCPGGIQIERTPQGAIWISQFGRAFTNDEVRGLIHQLQLVLEGRS